MTGSSGTPIGSGGRPSDDRIAPGTLIEERYEIRRLLGRGGQGDVYLAYDRNFALEVAIKFLHRDFRTDEILERFRIDAQVAVRLDHPNVVRVLDFNPKYPYIVMQFCGDGDLDRYIKSRKRRPLREILGIVRQMCDAIAAAHEHNPSILHRDIKPGNVMFVGNVPKVTDFGLAKMLGGEGGMTTTRGMMGTVRYCAPEQLKDASTVDHRADLWSVGVVLYELLTWRRPFDKSGDEFVNIAIRIHSEPPRKPPYDLPLPVAEILGRALEKNRDQRFQSARQMSQALEDAIQKLSTAGETLVPPQELVDPVSLMAAEVADLIKEGRTEAASKIIRDMTQAAPDESVTKFWRKRIKASSQLPSGSASQRSGERWITDQAAAVHSLLRRGDFRSAQGLLYEMLSKDPDNSAVQGLLGRVKEEEREFRAALDQAHRDADAARRGGDLQEVVRLWTVFLEAHPEVPEALAEKDVAVREIALEELRRAREEMLRVVDQARAAADLERALALAEEFKRRYPDDTETDGVLAKVREEKLRAERERTLAGLRLEVDRLRSQGDLKAALSRCDGFLLAYPGEKDLRLLREALRSEIETREREEIRAHLEEWLSRAERHLSAGRYGSVPENGTALARTLKTARASLGGDRHALEQAGTLARAAWGEAERRLGEEVSRGRDTLLRRVLEARGWIGKDLAGENTQAKPGTPRVAEMVSGALDALVRAGSLPAETDPVAFLAAAEQALAGVTRDLAAESRKLLEEKRAKASAALAEAGAAVVAGLGAAEGDQELSARIRTCEQRMAAVRSKLEEAAPDDLDAIAGKARVARAEAAALALAGRMRARRELEEAVAVAAPLLLSPHGTGLGAGVRSAGEILSGMGGGATGGGFRRLATAIQEQARECGSSLEARVGAARSRWRSAFDSWNAEARENLDSALLDKGREVFTGGEAAVERGDPEEMERWSALLEGLSRRRLLESVWLEQRDAVFIAESRARGEGADAGGDLEIDRAGTLEAYRKAIAGGPVEEIRSVGRELQKVAREGGKSGASEEAPDAPRPTAAMVRLNRRLAPERLEEFSGLVRRYEQCRQSGRRGEALRIFADLDAVHRRLLRPEPLWKHPGLAATVAGIAVVVLVILFAGGERHSVTLISLGGDAKITGLLRNGEPVSSLPGEDSVGEKGTLWPALKPGRYELRLKGGASRKFDLPGDEVVLVPGNVEYDSKVLMEQFGLLGPAGAGN